MTTTSFNLSTEKGFEDFNSLLLNQTFIVGYEPTNVDVKVFKLIVDNKLDAKRFTNVTRWFDTIAAYCTDEDFILEQINHRNLDFTVDSENDDDFDLFDASEDMSSLPNKERVVPVAKKVKETKSEVVMEVKTWDDTISMKDVEDAVRSVSMDGLKWGHSKLVPTAFKMHSLSIQCIVDDHLVSVQDLEDTLNDIEELIQSVDIISFNTYR
ncbi:elongation factor 1b-related protein [Cavenderia fasciculata]|uniref:Elongation factor 1b-related protein n=1 Tax=Cavenderia fasciculata TaxID=261658 RepID=F4PWC3_CACFS|nr:elongation factor 1b-related protein [Cavenderia fasciculata]EGG20287.1 elongation factor 1b-related protein [Cavenderia fasciculata]|eukprot:XP_004367270.1 elongation factor 1b-related protein [Cavenderia fasciculata]